MGHNLLGRSWVRSGKMAGQSFAESHVCTWFLVRRGSPDHCGEHHWGLREIPRRRKRFTAETAETAERKTEREPKMECRTRERRERGRSTIEEINDPTDFLCFLSIFSAFSISLSDRVFDSL